jgi:chemotaxis response regulator CheB
MVQSQLLLVAGIYSLLNRELDLHVFEASIRDEMTLLEALQKIKPTVMVLEASSPFSAQFSFLSPFQHCSDLRVIVVDERRNRMHIYEKRELEIGRAADLVMAVRSEAVPPD